jgi:ComF family protein
MGIISGMLNLVYPAVCGICDRKLLSEPEEDLLICADCAGKIKRNLPPYCRKCGRSLRGLVDSVETCWECSGKEFFYERSWSGFLYEGPVKDALHLLKYSGKLSLSNLFCRLLARFIRENPEIIEGVDSIAAVPLYSVKFREREFNQAHLLAAAIAGEFNITDLSRCLRRITPTRPQSELDRNERLENVKGTFEAVKPMLIHKKNLLIVDDLFTTGATLNECSKALKKMRAGKINCLTFARGA